MLVAPREFSNDKLFTILLPLPVFPYSLPFIPSTCNSLQADTQSLLSLRSTCLYHLIHTDHFQTFQTEPAQHDCCISAGVKWYVPVIDSLRASTVVCEYVGRLTQGALNHSTGSTEELVEIIRDENLTLFLVGQLSDGERWSHRCKQYI